MSKMKIKRKINESSLENDIFEQVQKELVLMGYKEKGTLTLSGGKVNGFYLYQKVCED